MRFLTFLNNAMQSIERIDFVDFLNGGFRSRISAGTLTADHTLLAPNKSGTIAVVSDIAGGAGAIAPGAVVAVTAVASIDWAIPAGVRRITFLGDQLYVGANPTLLRFGTSSGIVAAGYGSQTSYTQSPNMVSGIGFSTDGMTVPSVNNGQANDTVTMTLSRLEGSNTWVFSGVNHQSTSYTNAFSGGRIALASEVTTLRYVPLAGGVFSGQGKVHITWEF